MSGFNEQTIPIQFPRQQWEQILVMLARQPFNEVAPLIGEIQRQFQMAEMRRRTGAAQEPMLAPDDYGAVSRPNGLTAG
jgi:hypothetical protein